MNKSIDTLKTLHKELIDLVEKFSPEKREEELFDKWSLKDVLAHMIGWNNCLRENIEYLLRAEEPPFYGKVNEFNKTSVERTKNSDWQEIYEKFVQSGNRLIKAYEDLSSEYFQKKFWKKKSSTPAKFLEIVIDHYQKEHIPKISAVLLV